MVEAHLAARTGGPRIVISDERAGLRDSGGGIAHAAALIGTDPIFVANTDVPWIEGPMPALAALAELWDPAKMDIAILLAPRERSTGFERPEGFLRDPEGRLTHSNSADPPPPFNNIAFKASRDFDGFQPKAGLAYHLSPDATLWFSAAEAYQPGGFSPSQDDPTKLNYAKSTSEHYELGLSSRLLDGQLRASVNGFLIETKDYQVYRPLTVQTFQVLNAARARTWGAEGELRWEPVKGLELTVAAGWSQAEFRRFDAPNPTGAGLEDLGGRTINFVPQFTLDASGIYRLPCGWFVGAGVTAVGEYWFDERNTAKQSPYALLRLRAGWEKGNFGVAAFAHNLTDTKYYANALDLGPSQGFVGTPGDPQVFGIEVTGTF
jgi:outer membrane receptor protein involved in Fe transport